MLTKPKPPTSFDLQFVQQQVNSVSQSQGQLVGLLNAAAIAGIVFVLTIAVRTGFHPLLFIGATGCGSAWLLGVVNRHLEIVSERIQIMATCLSWTRGLSDLEARALGLSGVENGENFSEQHPEIFEELDGLVDGIEKNSRNKHRQANLCFVLQCLALAAGGVLIALWYYEQATN